MLLSGDECRRTQRGNNNAYCQDNALSWFDWELVEKHAELVRFTRELIHFRRDEPTVRRRDFFNGQPTQPGELPDVAWFGPDGSPMEWGQCTGSLTCVFGAVHHVDPSLPPPRSVMMLFHPGHEACQFKLPVLPRNVEWRQFVDTSAPTPKDVFPNGDGPIAPPSITLIHHTMMVFVSNDE
jgi:glycogen operon protein